MGICRFKPLICDEMKILEPQFGDHFVGRDYEIQELKSKIRNNGVVVVTGDRGIGKTNLMKILEEFFEKEKDCHYIEYGSLFSEEINRFFLPEQITTGAQHSISFAGFGGGAGRSWMPKEPSVLEYMEKSEEKIIFVENAQGLKKEEIETIFTATHRNDKLRFVLEIATPCMPDTKLTISPEQIVELKKLLDEDIETIIEKECPNFPEAILKKIIFLSKGYPYIARSLAYICDMKNTQDETLEFLHTLRDDDIKYNLDRIHKEVLETLGKDAQDVIKKLALAPPLLTLKVIEAFCGEEIDSALSDITDRGILRSKDGFYWMYHPLFRNYLMNTQRIAIGKRKEIYCKAMEKVKSEQDSIYLLFEVLKEPDIFKNLIEIAESYDAINSVGIQYYTWGDLKEANLAWSLILKRSGEAKDKKWESIALGNIGNIYQTKGELENALEFFDKSLKLDEELGRKEGIASQLGNMGNIYRIKGELDKSLEHYEKALKLNEELGIKEGIANQLGNIGNVYRIKGEHGKALEYYERALRLNEELSRKEGIARQLGNIGNVYRIKGEHGKALEYCEKALRLNEELGRKAGIASQLGNIGVIYQIKGELDKSLEYFEKALKLNEDIGIKEGIANQLENIGHTYIIREEFNNALKYYEKALKLYEELGSKEGVAAQLGNISNAYLIKEEFNNALEYYEKALKLYEELGSKEGIAAQLGNIGSVCFTIGAHDNAMKYYKKALKLDEELGIKEGIAVQLGNIGNVYLTKGELDNALEYYERALKLDVELEKKDGIATEYLNIGNVYKTKRELDKSLGYFEQTLRMFKELGSNIEIARTLMNIGDIFVLKGERERALDHYLEAQELAVDSPSLFRDISKKANELLGIK